MIYHIVLYSIYNYTFEKNLQTFLGSDYTEIKVDALLKDADTNGDDKISFNEFLHLFREDNKKQVKTIYGNQDDDICTKIVDSDRSCGDLITINNIVAIENKCDI